MGVKKLWHFSPGNVCFRLRRWLNFNQCNTSTNSFKADFTKLVVRKAWYSFKILLMLHINILVTCSVPWILWVSWQRWEILTTIDTYSTGSTWSVYNVAASSDSQNLYIIKLTSEEVVAGRGILFWRPSSVKTSSKILNFTTVPPITFSGRSIGSGRSRLFSFCRWAEMGVNCGCIWKEIWIKPGWEVMSVVTV